jgi:hypothetical protein
MRTPVPTNKLVAFTLAGALLTAVVAGALAIPGGLGQAGGSDGTAATSANVSDQLGADAPEPNQEFTPSVETQSPYSEHDEHGEENEQEEYEEEGYNNEYEDDYEEDDEDYEDGER